MPHTPASTSRRFSKDQGPRTNLADFIQIDAACDRFEAAYQAGESPDLAAYLAEVPAGARVPLFRNLLSLDIEYRRRRGEHPDLKSYRERFPDLADVDRAGVPVPAPEPDRDPPSRRQRDQDIDGTAETRSAVIEGQAREEEIEPRGGLDLDAFDELRSGRI